MEAHDGKLQDAPGDLQEQAAATHAMDLLQAVEITSARIRQNLLLFKLGYSGIHF